MFLSLVRTTHPFFPATGNQFSLRETIVCVPRVIAELSQVLCDALAKTLVNIEN
jgi:hypothetical protein